MNWYIQVLKKYAEFSGRARRKEYWMFVLFNVLISVVLTVIDFMLGTYSASVGVQSWHAKVAGPHRAVTSRQ